MQFKFEGTFGSQCFDFLSHEDIHFTSIGIQHNQSGLILRVVANTLNKLICWCDASTTNTNQYSLELLWYSICFRSQYELPIIIQQFPNASLNHQHCI